MARRASSYIPPLAAPTAARARRHRSEAHLFLGALLPSAETWRRLTPSSVARWADAHNNLGVNLARAGRLSEALEHFRRAAGLDPDSADIRNNLGLALAQLGRLAEAEAQFEAEVRLRPGFREAEGNLAQARKLQGK